MYLAFVLFALSVGQAVALVAILFRYAVPRSPNAFHAVVVVPMLAASGAAFILGLESLGLTRPLGAGENTYWAVFVTAEMATYWALNGYSYYWQTTGRHKQRSARD